MKGDDGDIGEKGINGTKGPKGIKGQPVSVIRTWPPPVQVSIMDLQVHTVHAAKISAEILHFVCV